MKLQKPFQGNFVITQFFGEKLTNPKGHSGIDYALPAGTAVLSAVEGTVIRVGNDPKGYGLYIILDHSDSIRTIYAHLSRCAVWKGQLVQAGELLGRSGNTGNSTGPHLHFEVQLNRKAIDPLPLLGGEMVPMDPQTAVNHGQKRIWKVSCDALNVRSGPGIGSPVIGRLRSGATVSELTTVETRWVQIAEGQWVAAVYDGQPLMATESNS